MFGEKIFHRFFFFKDFIYLFLERGREGEREEEKDQCVVATWATPTGDLARNPGSVLTRNGNGDPLVHSPAFKPLGHTSQGRFFFLEVASILFEILNLL